MHCSLVSACTYYFLHLVLQLRLSRLSLRDSTTMCTSGAIVTVTTAISTEHPTTTIPPDSTTQTLPTSSTEPESHSSSFRQYASKLGYPDNLITTVLSNLGPDASTEDLLSHLISLQNMLCPKDSLIRRRRDATYLPSYMLSQDSYYKGKEKMPYWVWVKRETITADVTTNPPHKRTRTTSSHSKKWGCTSQKIFICIFYCIFCSQEQFTLTIAVWTIINLQNNEL